MPIRGEKIVFFENILADFHKKAGREHLPWRGKGIGAYEIWVSEIMLQQTQVSRVIGYYEKFLARFPDVGALAKASWKEFLPYYQGLGYYARGRNMLKTAKEVVEKHQGKFPRDAEALRRLPGVGPYTAAAIASFAYGRNTIAWDTNLRRVVGRFFLGSKHFVVCHSREGGNPEEKKHGSRVKPGMTSEKLEQLFSLPAKTLNAAMMDFGSAICTARPKCGACPLSSRCVYFSEDGKQEVRSKKSGVRNWGKRKEAERKIDWRDARVFVILHENHKKYYSPFKTKFAPFIVSASHNTRAGIKDWFRRKYGLELSVRPPHKKELVDEKPTLFVNAQILSGKPTFRIFPREFVIRS
jgi:A/G-specific adenine glycosylase